MRRIWREYFGWLALLALWLPYAAGGWLAYFGVFSAPMALALSLAVAAPLAWRLAKSS